MFKNTLQPPVNLPIAIGINQFNYLLINIHLN